jgi:hypothetical protein
MAKMKNLKIKLKMPQGNELATIFVCNIPTWLQYFFVIFSIVYLVYKFAIFIT